MANLTDRTERALLGALLINPDQGQALTFLQRNDFASRRHGDILSGIRAARNAGRGPGYRWLNDVAMAAGPFTEPRELRDLEADCPAPAHAPAYAALVIEARARRILAQTLERITLETSGMEIDHRRITGIQPGTATLPSEIAEHMNALSAALRDALAFDPGRWPADRQLPAQEEQAASISSAMTPATPATAAWHPASWPGRDSFRIQNEETILAGLLQNHPDTARVIATVSPISFTDPLRRLIYDRIQVMHRNNEPVDQITVEWALGRRLAELTPGPAAVGQPQQPDSDDGYLARLAQHTIVGPAAMMIAAHALTTSAGDGEPAPGHALRRSPRRSDPDPEPEPLPARPDLRLIQPEATGWHAPRM